MAPRVFNPQTVADYLPDDPKLRIRRDARELHRLRSGIKWRQDAVHGLKGAGLDNSRLCRELVEELPRMLREEEAIVDRWGDPVITLADAEAARVALSGEDDRERHHTYVQTAVRQAKQEAEIARESDRLMRVMLSERKRNTCYDEHGEGANVTDRGTEPEATLPDETEEER